MLKYNSKKKDRFRHDLLGVLYRKFSKNQYLNLGYQYSDIEKGFKIERNELFELIAELFEMKEITLYDPHGYGQEGLGIVITNKGIDSYSSNKYKIRQRDSHRSNIKFFIDVIIPPLSIITAIVAIAISIITLKSENDNSNEILKLKKEIKILNKKNQIPKKSK